MILTVTLNAALDVTYEVAALVAHGTHRVQAVHERAGGKGVNAASVLTLLGVSATATGLAGGRVGDDIVADLDRRGIPNAFFRCADGSRRTVNVVSASDGDATIFNEPGPVVSGSEWAEVLAGLPALARSSGCAAVILAGSLPPGVPPDGYGQLVAALRETGVRVLLDADGPALRDGVRAGPDVVSPNLAELRAATGERDLVAGARALQAAGATDVCVSCGAEGLAVLTRDGRMLRARLEAPLAGNPTGAGDAVAAAVAAGLGESPDWPQLLTAAVSWSAAAVLQPWGGAVAAADVARLRRDVEVWEEPR